MDVPATDDVVHPLFMAGLPSDFAGDEFLAALVALEAEPVAPPTLTTTASPTRRRSKPPSRGNKSGAAAARQQPYEGAKVTKSSKAAAAAASTEDADMLETEMFLKLWKI